VAEPEDDVLDDQPKRVFGTKKVEPVVFEDDDEAASPEDEGEEKKGENASPEENPEGIEAVSISIEVEEAGGEQAARNYRAALGSAVSTQNQAQKTATTSKGAMASASAAKSSNAAKSSAAAKSGAKGASAAKGGAIGVMFYIPPKVLQRLAKAVPYDDEQNQPLHKIYRVSTLRRENINVESGEFQVTGLPHDIEYYRRALTSWLEYEVSVHPDYECPRGIDEHPCMPPLDLVRSPLEEVLFFPENTSVPNPHKELLASKPGTWRLLRFMQVLRSPKKTLDIAIYNLTADPIAQTLMDLAKKGVRVRVFTENDNVDSQGSDCRDLVKAGIEVRCDSASEHLMHHKFAVLDGVALLTGSFNWSVGASHGNFENVILTKNPPMVRAFKEEFERIWTMPGSTPLSANSKRQGPAKINVHG